MIVYRTLQVRRAFDAQDEDAARGELTALSREAALLAAQPLLIESPLLLRQRIASEREPSGRGGSS
jgi:hypothetical protein